MATITNEWTGTEYFKVNDFNHLELSFENLQLLIKKYPESKFAPQSLYVLSYYEPEEDRGH